MRWLPILALLTALAGSGQGQSAFDVASVRPADASLPFERNGQISLSHGTLQMRAVPLRACIAFAYGVSLAQIAGPASLGDWRYDIVAKAGPTSTEPQVRLMLVSLLAERFHLTIHHETRQLRGYVLRVKAPPKGPAWFHPSATPGELYRQNSASGTVARNISMVEFADFLSGVLDAPVEDATSLRGNYDLKLDFTPFVSLTGKPEDQPSAEWVLNAALGNELGLTLTAGKASFAVVVVDHVDKPTPD